MLTNFKIKLHKNKHFLTQVILQYNISNLNMLKIILIK